VELDSEKGPQLRVREGQEHAAFLALWSGNMIIHRSESMVFPYSVIIRKNHGFVNLCIVLVMLHYEGFTEFLCLNNMVLPSEPCKCACFWLHRCFVSSYISCHYPVSLLEIIFTVSLYRGSRNSPSSQPWRLFLVRGQLAGETYLKVVHVYSQLFYFLNNFFILLW
jgi:hypothetical protein